MGERHNRAIASTGNERHGQQNFNSIGYHAKFLVVLTVFSSISLLCQTSALLLATKQAKWAENMGLQPELNVQEE